MDRTPLVSSRGNQGSGGGVMAMRARIATVVAAVVVAASAVAATPGLHAASTRSCGFVLMATGSQFNLLFPDESATYWAGGAPLPPGGAIEIKGRYPHARYMSIAIYTGQLQSIDGLHDAAIAADPGSTNPFVAGADRDAAARSYTVRIVRGRVPASGRARNTIYTTSADGSRSGGPLIERIILRIYEPDQGLGRTGDVPLPDMTVVLPDGKRLPIPSCPDVALPDLGLQHTIANSGSGDPAIVPLSVRGDNPPVWRRFTNVVAAVTNGSPISAAFPDGGFADNPDNKYMTTFFSQNHGQVLAFRAKLPTYPATYHREAVMGTGQLRYWSFCSNAITTAFYGCRQDDQIPLDGDGNYTIVVSTAAARPKNATESCGAAWVPAGPLPNAILIVRNMLPDPVVRRSDPEHAARHRAGDDGSVLPAGHVLRHAGRLRPRRRLPGLSPDAPEPGRLHEATGQARRVRCVIRERAGPRAFGDRE